MLLVQAGGAGPQPWPEPAFMNAVAAGQIHPSTPVSVDAGRSWIPASLVAQRLRARGDDGLALLVPTRTEGWSLAAGYVALFSLLFFGGPLVFGAVVVAFDKTSGLGGKLAFAGIAFVLGAVPPGALGLLGLRGLRRDPTYRGKGRAFFALACAGLMAAGVLIAVCAAPLTH